jgi:hypothetical protein
MFSRLANKKLWIIFFSLTSVFLFLHIHLYEPKQENQFDAAENLVSAFTIAKANTYSINLDPQPTAKREPFFPLLVGLVIKIKSIFISGADNLNLQKIETINKLKLINVFILFMTIVLACSFIYRYTKNYFLVTYCGLTLIFSAALAGSAHSFLSEVLTGFLSLSMAIMLYSFPKYGNNKFYYLFLGILLSALVLTKAMFLYFIPIILAYFVLMIFKTGKTLNKKMVQNIVLFMTCLAVIVGGWMLRNYIDFNRFFVAERREVLNVRAEYDYLSSAEYPYLYAVWAPGLSKYFLTEDTKKDWTRLVNRLGNDQVILDTIQIEYMNFFRDKKMNPNGSYNQSDYIEHERRALKRIKANPIGHLKLTLAFIYRFLFIEDGAGLEYLGFKLPHEDNYDKRIDSFSLALLVNVPVWLCFLYSVLCVIRKKDFALLGLLLIPSYVILAYSFLAFSHPRYVIPLIPIFAIISGLSMAGIFESFMFYFAKKRNVLVEALT